jgi:MFS superfamily sulfate permease-like transporter
LALRPDGRAASCPGLLPPLGIAIASGAPPITGGLGDHRGSGLSTIRRLLRDYRRPAAGLAPALLSGMLLLGNGDLATGYPLLLVAICLTGLLQIILTIFKVGEFAKIIPMPVMEGMLAAIGLIIIVKQIPPLVGDLSPLSKSIPLAILSLPSTLWAARAEVARIGIVSLVLMFWLSQTHNRWLRILLAPLLRFIGIVLATPRTSIKYRFRYPTTS